MSESANKAGDNLNVPPEFTLVTDETPADTKADAPTTTDQGWQIARELMETVVLSLIIFFVIRLGVQNYRIESHSMDPNFAENQFVLVNKLSYRFGEPQRGDVVVFHNPNNTREDYIKRVVGLPGDTLELVDGNVYVNGSLLEEPLIHEPTWGLMGQVVVSPDHLFVMRDNRTNSRDSRNFGELPMDLVVGKAWLRIWPFDKFGWVPHQVSLDEAAAMRDQ